MGSVGIEIMLELHEPAIMIDQPLAIFWVNGESKLRRSCIDADQHFLTQITGHEILVSSVWAVGMLLVLVNGHGLIGRAGEIKGPFGIVEFGDWEDQPRPPLGGHCRWGGGWQVRSDAWSDR